MTAQAYCRKTFYKSSEVSKMLCKSESWLRKSRMIGQGPKFVTPNFTCTRLYPFSEVVEQAERNGILLNFERKEELYSKEFSLQNIASLLSVSKRTIQKIKNSKSLKFPAHISDRASNSPRYDSDAIYKFFGLEV